MIEPQAEFITVAEAVSLLKATQVREKLPQGCQYLHRLALLRLPFGHPRHAKGKKLSVATFSQAVLQVPGAFVPP